MNEILKSLLPGISTVLLGPVGGAAVTWIANKIGVDSSDTKAITDAVQGMSPEDRIKLENEANQWAVAEQNRMIEVFLKDTQDARARDVEFLRAGKVNVRANLMVLATFLGILACVSIAVAMSNINDFGKTIVNVVIGVLLADWKQITSFEFGTTRSSSKKDDTINTLVKE